MLSASRRLAISSTRTSAVISRKLLSHNAILHKAILHRQTPLTRIELPATLTRRTSLQQTMRFSTTTFRRERNGSRFGEHEMETRKRRITQILQEMGLSEKEAKRMFSIALTLAIIIPWVIVIGVVVATIWTSMWLLGIGKTKKEVKVEARDGDGRGDDWGSEQSGRHSDTWRGRSQG